MLLTPLTLKSTTCQQKVCPHASRASGIVTKPILYGIMIFFRNRLILATKSGDVQVWDLDTQRRSIFLPGKKKGRVYSMAVSPGGTLILGHNDGNVRVLKNGSLVCQMKVRDPDNPEVTPGHVSHICHVKRDNRDHVTVMTSGGLLCSWSISQKRPELVYCTRQGMMSPCFPMLINPSLQVRSPGVPD